MARIIRGKYKGLEVELSQWCNDWVMIDISKTSIPANKAIFSVKALEYTEKEILGMVNSNSGHLWVFFETYIRDDFYIGIRKKKRDLNLLKK